MKSCYLICGTDAYRSDKARRAIESRFLTKQDSGMDLITYDMDETSIETLKQTMLTVPFFVTHRLFVLKNVFSLPKASLEACVALLDQMSLSTVVVIYESKPCDKRLALYKWVVQHGKIQDHSVPTGASLSRWIQSLATEFGVTIESQAEMKLALYFGADSWRMVQEVKKIAVSVLSEKRTKITVSDVERLSISSAESSTFALSDALRDGKLAKVVSVYRDIKSQEDPMLIAALLASQVRTLAKLFLCQSIGITRSDEVASRTKLNPYVVKLALPMVQSLSPGQLKKSYASLVAFDAGIKEGEPPDVSLLLLIIRLHGTLRG